MNGRPVLRVQAPELAPARHAMANDTIVLGRGADCTLPIRDRFLSRRHAEVALVGTSWVLRDCESANGTFLNGTRIDKDVVLRFGDEIRIGDTSIFFEEGTSSGSLQLSEDSASASIIIPLADLERRGLGRESERLTVLAALAIELIEERSTETLLEFVVDRVHSMLAPSRTAIAVFDGSEDQLMQTIVRGAEETPLSLSRTLLHEVTVERKAIAFIDVASDERFAQAKSIVGQSIRSAVCAPLLTADKVLGVLYVDYVMTQHDIAEEDVRLLARIARLAATKIETARLREDLLSKQRMEAELRTAYEIQSRLLPAKPPQVGGYSVAGVNRPARTVSGDYFDYLERSDGRFYFVIADVAGKGITAALVMAGLSTAFRIYAEEDPTPADLVSKLNRILASKMAPGKFVTLFAGILHPETGRIEFTNAGHCPPIYLGVRTGEKLSQTDMVIGLFPQAPYRNQEIFLQPGEGLMLFTDGIIEAENAVGEEMGEEAIVALAEAASGRKAEELLSTVYDAVTHHTGGGEQGDDITMVALMRHHAATV